VSTTTSRISTIGLVSVPSVDQDGAIAFYTDVLGFEKRTDIPFGDNYRWVEVYPPSGTTGVALAPPPPGSATKMETGIILNTDDIEATYSALRERGVDVDAEISRMGDPIPPMFWFRDPNGNSLLIVETS
jgi:predicted enzyme related to lactoylglutathione lyase